MDSWSKTEIEVFDMFHGMVQSHTYRELTSSHRVTQQRENNSEFNLRANLWLLFRAEWPKPRRCDIRTRNFIPKELKTMANQFGLVVF